MASLETAETGAPPPRIRPRLSSDDWVMRAYMIVVILYLLVTLVLPLYAMLSRSFSTFSFDLSAYEFQVDKGEGFGPVRTAAELNAETQAVPPEKLAATGDGRLSVTGFFPDFSFRSTTRYRIRNVTADGHFLFGSERIAGTAWHDYSSNDFRRLSLRPARSLGLANYLRYFQTPALSSSIWNSLFISLLSTLITVSLAFGFSYAIQRTRMPMKPVFRLVAMIPILVPSLLPGIALVYLFGNQGFLKSLLFGNSIYGPIGIVIGTVFFTFPHAFLIIQTALSIADQRLYEASTALRASPWRTFWTVTVPGARYGLVSAAFVVFNLAITDFGLPKVIGGQFNVLAVDIYKQVIGQQNFEMGAVVSVVLLLPALLAFAIDHLMQRRQVALLSARSVPYEAKRSAIIDNVALVYCLLVALFIAGLLAVCQYAALVKLWPYNLELTLHNFNFDIVDGGGWASFWNSIELALWTAAIGTVIVFTGAYMVEKSRGFTGGRTLFHLFAMMPMAIPGMVLGLAYIFFFNDPANPLHAIYGTMAILVVCTVTHFYTVSHLTALTALKQMDPEFEAVSASLKQPFHRLFAQVTVPVSLPAILDISIYLFVNAMTTVSAVVFLYAPHTTLASVAVLNMDDAGDIAPAAAMGMMIFYTNAIARGVHLMLTRGVTARTQAWRRR
ncbi:MAG: putative 2-aminoethylphosphonate ABC transporter permease subunit [Hyphomicrobiaceae bacterium]